MSLSLLFAVWLEEILAQVLAAAELDVGLVGEAFFRAVLGDAAWESLPEGVREVAVANGSAILAEELGGPLGVTTEELGSITMPTLVVGARGSGPAFAEVAELTARAVPLARLEWVAGDHLIDAAAPAVLAFVDEVLRAAVA